MNIEYNYRSIAGKEIKEAHFKVKPNDFMMLLSDGVVYAGIGEAYEFGLDLEKRKRVCCEQCYT